MISCVIYLEVQFWFSVILHSVQPNFVFLHPVSFDKHSMFVLIQLPLQQSIVPISKQNKIYQNFNKTIDIDKQYLKNDANQIQKQVCHKQHVLYYYNTGTWRVSLELNASTTPKTTLTHKTKAPFTHTDLLKQGKYDDDYDSQTVSWNHLGLKFPDICLMGEEKPQIDPYSGNYFRLGMLPQRSICIPYSTAPTATFKLRNKAYRQFRRGRKELIIVLLILERACEHLYQLVTISSNILGNCSCVPFIIKEFSSIPSPGIAPVCIEHLEFLSNGLQYCILCSIGSASQTILFLDFLSETDSVVAWRLCQPGKPVCVWQFRRLLQFTMKKSPLLSTTNRIPSGDQVIRQGGVAVSISKFILATSISPFSDSPYRRGSTQAAAYKNASKYLLTAQNKTVRNRPRSGQLQSLRERVKAVIVRSVKKNPKANAHQIRRLGKRIVKLSTFMVIVVPGIIHLFPISVPQQILLSALCKFESTMVTHRNQVEPRDQSRRHKESCLTNADGNSTAIRKTRVCIFLLIEDTIQGAKGSSRDFATMKRRSMRLSKIFRRFTTVRTKTNVHTRYSLTSIRNNLLQVIRQRQPRPRCTHVDCNPLDRLRFSFRTTNSFDPTTMVQDPVYFPPFCSNSSKLNCLFPFCIADESAF
ncbi:hypothetical protein C0J52_09303 [Blattella germanica]|nr:hypothetical protein C0J52_09303 [Blattella germanica]